VAEETLCWPDVVLLRSALVTAACAQRHPVDIGSLLLCYAETEAHDTQTMFRAALLLTRYRDATPDFAPRSLHGVNESSIHLFRRQCKEILKNYDRDLPYMRKEMKTAQVNLRIHPSLKAAAEKAAEAGHRSLTSLVEKLLADYCKRKGFLK
jgi:predicted HicB family RNase H-like nuclease